MKKTRSIHRRAFLRGALGTAVALPWLEAVGGARSAQAAPLDHARFLVAFGGISTPTHDVGHEILPAPGAVDFTDTTGLAPLRDLGLQQNALFVSRLRIPYEGGPGNRSLGFHSSSIKPLLSGVTSTHQDYNLDAQTADSVMAERLSPGVGQLAVRVQYDWYKVGSWLDRSVSYNGFDQPVPPYFSPADLYQAFTSHLTATDDELAQRKFDAARGASVLDYVNGETKRLETRLGAADRHRLEGYFERLRDLEKKLQGPVAGSCQPIDGFPTDDSALAPAILAANIVTGELGCDPYADGEDGGPDDICRGNGCAFETERGALFMDLLALAFECDIHRSASLMTTYPQCWMSAIQMLDGTPYAASAYRIIDLHELGHMLPDEPGLLAYFYRWHVEFIARLADKLRNIPWAEGTLLDYTPMTLLCEGGWGYDPETNTDGTAHSTEDMCALVVGGQKLGLTAGGHVEAPGAHPAQVLLSTMRAATGDESLALGEVTEPIDGLLAG